MLGNAQGEERLVVLLPAELVRHDRYFKNMPMISRAHSLVSVRDREVPIWRISMSDKIVRARWMEILREEIDELPTMPRS